MFINYPAYISLKYLESCGLCINILKKIINIIYNLIDQVDNSSSLLIFCKLKFLIDELRHVKDFVELNYWKDWS